LSLTLYPLNLPGQIYGSPKPFGLYDPDGLLLQGIKAADIFGVVLLAELEECRDKNGRDLLAAYREKGLAVFPLPIANYDTPSTGRLADVLKHINEHAAQGDNLLIHCSAGLGRTAQLDARLTPAHMYGSG
jgi:hypothetical protein